jgi:hypothetical protein
MTYPSAAMIFERQKLGDETADAERLVELARDSARSLANNDVDG